MLAGISGKITPTALRRELQSFEGQLATSISSFAGSMPFVYFHVLWFGFWIYANKGYLLPLVPVFDPFPYGLLTMIVSLEAIFLSTFIMISQNRQAILDTYRDLEDEKEEKEDEKEVEDMQKDLDDIKNAMLFIQQKISNLEHNPKTPFTTPQP